MTWHMQDSNAGNLGDYLKHFYLIKLVDLVTKQPPAVPIAYVDTHAGAGVYTMKDKHWENRNSNRELVNSSEAEWRIFDRLNPNIEEKHEYLGSFVLVGRLLTEKKGVNSELIIFENDDDIVKRIKEKVALYLPKYNLGPFGKSDPISIKIKISELRSTCFKKVVCLIDPYSANKVWSDLLDYDSESCFILLFDFSNKPDKDGFKWNCGNRMPIIWKKDLEGDKGYALFGNRNTQDLLRSHNSLDIKEKRANI